ncbi:hypothetical protein PoB_003649700 [Plakobranchus ocellatus]|uniref:Secreted protein n=1 Tax=Plakobranchus ocellatus TaxID=259542 RepID=A0AAV4ASU8_9GAST|nr:hypothetical protein PoB_003649700 [Plakobranchus ocellatus]
MPRVRQALKVFAAVVCLLVLRRVRSGQQDRAGPGRRTSRPGRHDSRALGQAGWHRSLSVWIRERDRGGEGEGRGGDDDDEASIHRLFSCMPALLSWWRKTEQAVLCPNHGYWMVHSRARGSFGP